MLAESHSPRIHPWCTKLSLTCPWNKLPECLSQWWGSDPRIIPRWQVLLRTGSYMWWQSCVAEDIRGDQCWGLCQGAQRSDSAQYMQASKAGKQTSGSENVCPITSCLTFKDRLSQWTWSSLFPLDWLANELLMLHAFALTAEATDTCNLTQIFAQVLGIRTQVLMFVQQSLYPLSYLPSP
jgi:hypothetical protein